MTDQEHKNIVRVCGKDYKESDIPTYIRNREEPKLSVCCGARLIGGCQCEACGADGRASEEFPLR